MKGVLRIVLLSFSMIVLPLYAGKTALVTGAAGFLGSHMCELLILEGYTVFGLDNLYSGNLENLESIINHPHFTFVKHDIEQYYDPKVSLDEIYNFACPASPIFYQMDPLKTMRTNVFGSLNLLELAKKNDAIIFQASTSEIYGDPLEHPQKESYWGNVNPIGIRSCYDEGKRCAETLFFDYHRTYGISIKVVRIFNTYGPRMRLDDGRVVSSFLVQALKNEPITIYGTGNQTRSFCYVSDLIEAIYQFVHTDRSILGPINLGNPEEYTILEVAQRVLDLTSSDSPLSFKPLPLDDPKMRKPDITYAKEILSWTPKVSFEEGLEQLRNYFIRRVNHDEQ